MENNESPTRPRNYVVAGKRGLVRSSLDMITIVHYLFDLTLAKINYCGRIPVICVAVSGVGYFPESLVRDPIYEYHLRYSVN